MSHVLEANLYRPLYSLPTAEFAIWNFVRFNHLMQKESLMEAKMVNNLTRYNGLWDSGGTKNNDYRAMTEDQIDKNLTDLRHAVAERRESEGYTQRAAAKRVGVSQGTINNWENHGDLTYTQILNWPINTASNFPISLIYLGANQQCLLLADLLSTKYLKGLFSSPIPDYRLTTLR